MSISTEAFTAAYSAFPEMRCRVRVRKRDIIEQAICSGLTLSREDLDEGQSDYPSGNVRYLKSAESNAVNTGDAIEVMRTANGETKYRTFRAMSRLEISGIVHIELEGLHG